MADINGIPYVEATDLVSAYPGTSLALATELDTQLASKVPFAFGTATPTTTVSGFLWYDTNFTPPVGKVWNGTAFVIFSQGPADFSDAATGTYTDGGVDYKYITYNSSGTLTVTRAGFADVMVIGGGGPGGRAAAYSGSGTWRNGGGGAGGYVDGTYYLDAATYTVTVGAGGAGSGEGVAGSDSRLGNIAAAGGGRGSLHRIISGNVAGYTFKGGSGGGGMSVVIPPTNVGAPGILTQGNAGASGSGSNFDGGGGGGGANAAGSAPSGTTGGAGGAGKASSITGTSVTRGGGGGGAGTTGGAGGTGGGGAGTSSGNGGNGLANTGGGGGGCSSPNDTNSGGAGGSGVVIVRVKV